MRPDPGPKIDSSISAGKAITDVEGMRLDINQFRTTGMTVVQEAEVKQALAPFIGPNKRFQDLLDAAAALKRELAGRGYFLTDVIVPEQKIVDGIVELRVLEGRLGKVRLEVDPDVSIKRYLLESYLGSLQEGGLIRTADVERALFQIHDLRGIVARSSFAPGAKPGTADLTIKVSRGKAFDVNLDFDANGSIYTGQHRAGAGIDANSLMGMGELLSLRTTSAIDGDLGFVRLSALVPVGPWGSKIGAAYTELNYHLGTSKFDALDASGEAQVGSLTAIHPFMRSRNTNLLAIFQYDQRTMRDIQATSGKEVKKTNNVSSLSLAGDFRDRLFGGGINIFNASYTSGDLKYLAPTLTADRLNEGMFSKSNVTLSRLQAVSGRLALYGAFSQQFTDQNLDPSEKFSLGGPNAVRAYPQGEGSGDEGYFGTIETRYRLPFEDRLPGSLVLTAFYDFGDSVLIKKPSAQDIALGTALRRRIAGHGVGINWEVPNNWYLRATVAFADTDPATADHLLRSPRFYLQASKFF